MSDNKTIQTVHGDVEYEVETCVSCEQEYKKDEMEMLHQGTLLPKGYGHDEIKHVRTMYICQSCVEKPIKVRLADKENEILQVLLAITTINFFIFFIVAVLI